MGAEGMNEPAFSWTEERVETLKALWAERRSATVIAERLGAPSRNAILGKINRMGLSQSRPPALPRPPRPPRVRRRAPFRPPAVMPSPPKDSPAASPAPARPCSLLELTNESCRYPVSPEGEAYLFCAALEADFAKGIPYCRACCRIAYRRPGERE
jgi:GcrA cell cycle regulator